MKKSLCKVLFLLVVICFACTGCSEEEKSDKDKLIEDMVREFDVSNKSDYKNVVALLVEGEPVYVDEVMWYIFLLEDSMKIYSQAYESGTNESYWDQTVEGTVTMGQMYTDDIISQIAYNQVLSSMAAEDGIQCDKENIEAEAKKVIANISEEDIEKYGLTEEAYIKMQTKWELVDKYIYEIGKEAGVDVDKIKKEHPMEEFEGKINSEFMIVLFTYTDANGEKQVCDNETINQLVAELEEARKEAADNKDMKEIAEKYPNVLHFESSFFAGDKSASSIYEETVLKLSSGEMSQVTLEALSAYVIKRLDDSKEKDYEEYIEGLALEERKAYGETKAKELTENIANKLNDNVWKTIGVGKNNS